MKCLIIVLSAAIFFFSCSENPQNRIEEQNRLFKKDYKKVLGEIENMITKDQDIRHLAEYGTSDTTMIDSMRQAYNAKGIDLDSLYFINDTFLVSSHFSDSIHRIMKSLQETHTKRLIALINKYGYPESDRIDSTLHISPLILMHHPTIEYKDTMMKLLKLELAAKRIDTISFEMIKWDYNDRKGLPNLPGMKVHKNNDGTTTIEL